MILPPLTHHLAVCAQVEVPRFLERDRSFWHVLSIRHVATGKLDLRGARSVLTMYFGDLDTPTSDLRSDLLRPQQVSEIWRYVADLQAAPLLIHCMAGQCRSTAVAAAIIARALYRDGTALEDLAEQIVDRLLRIRPQAAPSGHVLNLMLEPVIGTTHASKTTQDVWEDVRIMKNRFVKTI